MKAIRVCAAIVALAIFAACSPKKEIVQVEKPQGPEKNGVVVEGVINGGGGKGVLCSRDGEQVLEVLDIYEGRSLYDQTYQQVEGLNFDELRAVYADRFAKHFNSNYVEMEDSEKEDWIQKFKDEAKFTKPGQSLKSTSDSDEPFVEQGCELVQIAVYYDEAVLLIDTDYWEMLNDFNKASLLAHEMIYSYRRRAGKTNSISSRRFVSHLISDQGLTPWFWPAAHDEEPPLIAQCSTVENHENYFLLVQEGDDIRMIVTRLDNEMSIFHRSAILEDMSVNDFMLPDNTGVPAAYGDLYEETSSLAQYHVSILGNGGGEDGGTFQFEFAQGRSGADDLNLTVACWPHTSYYVEATDLKERLKSNFSGKLLHSSHTNGDVYGVDTRLGFSAEADEITMITTLVVPDGSGDTEQICSSTLTQKGVSYVWVRGNDHTEFTSMMNVERQTVHNTGQLDRIIFNGQTCQELVASHSFDSDEEMQFGIEVLSDTEVKHSGLVFALP